MPQPPPTPVVEPWLAPWFSHPGRSELVSGHHLRPLRLADVGLPGLPLLDLAVVVAAAAARAGFVYGLFDDEERCVLGTVTLAPGAALVPVVDAVVRYATPDHPTLATALATHLPTWLKHTWPFHTHHLTEVEQRGTSVVETPPAGG